MMELILLNKSLDVNVKDPKTGINAFWIAACFRYGLIMKQLAEAGIDVLVQNNRGMNALHIACS